MKKLFTILFLSSLGLNAQVNLDSLWNVWTNQKMDDSLRMKALSDYAWDGFLYSQPDSTYFYADILLDEAQKFNSLYFISEAYTVKGSACRMLGRKIEAISYFEKSIEIDEKIGDQNGIAMSYTNIGGAYTKLGDPGKALEYLLKATEILREQNMVSKLPTVLYNLGSTYFLSSDLVKAKQYFEEAYEMAKENKSHRIMGSLEIALSAVYRKFGNSEKAAFYLNQAIETAKITGNRFSQAGHLKELAVMEYKQGNYEKSENLLTQSFAIYDDLDSDQGRGDVLDSQGDLYFVMKNYQLAEEYYEKSMKVRRSDKYLRQLLNSYVDLSYLYLQTGRYQESIDSMRISNEIAEKINSKNHLKMGYELIFRANMGSDNHQNALASIIEVIQLLEEEIRINFEILSEKERELYFQTMATHFNLFSSFANEHGEQFPKVYKRQFNQALSQKGLLLKGTTLMRNTILNSGDSSTIALYQSWIGQKELIAQSYASGRDITKLDSTARELEIRLVMKSREFAQSQELNKQKWQDVQSSLQEGEYAVEFIRFDQHDGYINNEKKHPAYAALIVGPTSDRPTYISLGNEIELEKIIGTFPGNNLSYIEQVYGTNENTKSRLYDLIWKPLEKELVEAKKVYVSPVGLLHKISFAALAKEQDVYLCDNHEIQVMSSTAKIALSENSQIKSKIKVGAVSLFGGIDYNSDSTSTEIWNYLDGSLDETASIEKILKKEKREFNHYTLSNATEAQFKSIASHSKVLHIATHGFFYADSDLVHEESVDQKESEENLVFRGGRTGMGTNTFVKSRNPLMRSGLAFAGANDVWNRTSIEGEDGVLTAAEVATIDMRDCDLVVLSACETGLGDIKGSEGVYGLQRSFKMAGVKYLIMSLWQVPDKETAEFMTSFYKNLTKTDDIKKSFNMTQQEMRKKYDPYYWAAFILVE